MAGVGGVGLGVVGTAVALQETPLSAGDFLSFAGAMLGVALTIWGTLFIESWKAERGLAKDQRRLSDAIKEVRAARQYLVLPFQADGPPPSLQLHSRYMLLEEALEALNYAADRIVLDDINIWKALRDIQVVISIRVKAIQPHLERFLIDPGPPDEIERLRDELAKYVVHLDRSLRTLEALP